MDERDASINHNAISNVTSIRVGFEQSHARRARLVIFARDHDLRTGSKKSTTRYPVSLSILHTPPETRTRRARDVRHHTSVVTGISRNRTRSNDASPRMEWTDADTHAVIINPSHARVRDAFRTSNPAGNPGLVRLTNSIADADDPLAIPDVPDRDIVRDIVVRRRRLAKSSRNRPYPFFGDNRVWYPLTFLRSTHSRRAKPTRGLRR